MRKALIVGIDYYENSDNLNGCVSDAYNVKSVLERHANGSINFDVNLMVATDSNSMINRGTLKDSIEHLFENAPEVALFYFSGHGYIESSGGFLITSDCDRGDDGLDLNILMTIANQSHAKNKIIILDSCYSGQVGNINIINNSLSLISEGMTILTACNKDQTAIGTNLGGIFTNLFVDALHGGASNLLGDITPGSVYAHIDQSLGSWAQRPIFKTNIKEFISLRKTVPSIDLDDLRMINKLFSNPSEIFALDPSFEPEHPDFNEKNGEKFEILQKYNRVDLVVPVNAKHMYFAAVNSTGCKLTALGTHYWNLANNERI